MIPTKITLKFTSKLPKTSDHAEQKIIKARILSHTQKNEMSEPKQ
jgi:hypothetical protein